MAEQFEVPELESTSGPAFDWLLQELELPPGADTAALREAFMRLRHEGARNAAKKLLAVWPEGAHWPSGEAWVKDKASGLRDRLEDVLFLLHVRHGRVAHRLYRHAQIREAIHPDSPHRNNRYTRVIINRLNLSDDDAETNVCGLKFGQTMSIAAGLVFMQKPAHAHPDCHCTIDPYDPVLAAKLEAL